jgi:hypothetical protein
MTALEWDKIGDRRYETGVDRGVLYLREGNAVPWNGLTSVNEERSREVKSYYIDGVKYLDHHVPGSYSASLSAFTYPDELDELMGNEEFAPGVILHDQKSSIFHLSYRTMIGNDLEGVDFGYRLHILYNLMAIPSNAAMASIGESVTPVLFEWKLTGTPSTMYGVRPTSHISIDSRHIDPDLLVEIESLLYGTVDTNPVFPTPIQLLNLIEGEGAPAT